MRQGCNIATLYKKTKSKTKKLQTNQPSKQKVLFYGFCRISNLSYAPLQSERFCSSCTADSEASVGFTFLSFLFYGERDPVENVLHHLKEDRLEIEAITKA